MDIELLFSKADLFRSIIYFAILLIVVFPTDVIVCSGLTIENIFHSLLGNEAIDFMHYHMKRTTLALLLHSLIPLSYYVMLVCTSEEIELLIFSSFYMELYFMFSVLLPLFMAGLATYWYMGNWKSHPICKKIKMIAKSIGVNRWQKIIYKIDRETTALDKVVIGGDHIRPSNKIVITENWIINTGMYTLDFAYQNKTLLHVQRCDSIPVNRERMGDFDTLSYDDLLGAQVLRIAVVETETKRKMFYLNINSNDFENAKRKLAVPIKYAEGVKIQLNLEQQFVTQFEIRVLQNPVPHDIGIPKNYVLEPCIGCSEVTANVKIYLSCTEDMTLATQPMNSPLDHNYQGRHQPYMPRRRERHDSDDEQPDTCVRCHCKPMWCVSCLGRWFASRQMVAGRSPHEWMSQKASCPNCRAIFCVLDVLVIDDY